MSFAAATSYLPPILAGFACAGVSTFGVGCFQNDKLHSPSRLTPCANAETAAQTAANIDNDFFIFSPFLYFL